VLTAAFNIVPKIVEGDSVESVLFLLAIAGLVPLFLNLILTPIILQISHRNNWYDHMDHRKIHHGEVPRLGGVGFFLSFILSLIIAGFIFPQVASLVHFALSPRIIFTLLGFGVVHILGLIDDFRNIRARTKLAGQILAGVLIVLGGAIIPGFTVPFFNIHIQFGFLAAPLTVFWLISLSNAINLMDGIDALAGGISFLGAVFFTIINCLFKNYTGALMSAVLSGALFGFLVFNRPRAKIFMGDSGSLFLGFALGSLLFMNDSPTALTFSPSSMQITILPLTNMDLSQILTSGGILATLSVLLLPVGDMITAMLRRIRRGTPIYVADREHIHHKYLNYGYSVPRILSVLLGVVALDGAAAVFWALVHSGRITAPLWLGDLVVLAVWLGTAGFLLINHHRNNKLRRQQAEEH
jgi:UDP-GlcNAc:undecaprenyl-phosphate GlcNAc-1-phosphate transferase